MAKKASPGGAIDVEGIYKFLALGTRNGTASGLAVTQKASGADMSVDISAGGGLAVTSDLKAYFGWSDAVINKSVTAADPSNPRKSIVVGYIDLSQISTLTTNNTDAFDIKVVDGTPGASPSDPSDSAIQTAVGAGNPWFKLARITLPAAAGSVVNAYLADIAPRMVPAQPYVYGGASNTKGHLVPNVADDTVALLSATQTFGANTTLSGSSLSNPNMNGASWNTYVSGGWMPATGTWSYISSTQIQVPAADATLIGKGTKIWINQSGSKWFSVVDKSGTTITVTAGTDYTVANVAITSPFFSNADSPYGFPGDFTYSPTVNILGGTAPTSATAGYTLTKFRVVRDHIILRVYRVWGSAGSGNTGATVTLPVAASAEGLATAAVNVATARIAYTGGVATVDAIYDSSSSTVVLTFGSVALTQFGFRIEYAI